MFSFVLGAVASLMFVGAEDRKAQPAQSLDGAWAVVCYEKDGQPQADAKGMVVKAENGTITCNGRDGKAALTLKVQFGPNGTVQVTEANADTAQPAGAAKAGVYVLTKDYVAISVNAEPAARGDGGAARGDAKPGETAKARCSLILRREGVRAGDDK